MVAKKKGKGRKKTASTKPKLATPQQQRVSSRIRTRTSKGIYYDSIKDKSTSVSSSDESCSTNPGAEDGLLSREICSEVQEIVTDIIEAVCNEHGDRDEEFGKHTLTGSGDVCDWEGVQTVSGGEGDDDRVVVVDQFDAQDDVFVATHIIDIDTPIALTTPCGLNVSRRKVYVKSWKKLKREWKYLPSQPVWYK